MAPSETPEIKPPTAPETVTAPKGGAEQPITEGSLRMKSQDLGLSGKLFGSREHAPINIAGFLIMFGIVGMLVAPALPASAGFSVGDMEKSFAALILAALTFLGGYLGGGGASK